MSVGGGLLATLGCAGDTPTDAPGAPGRRFRPLPGGDLYLTPDDRDHSMHLEGYLHAALSRAVTGIGEPRVILGHAGGRPYLLTRPVRVPEGVTLEGESRAGERPRLVARHGGQLVLARNSVCQGLHLVGPGPNSVREPSEVVPGINSGGQVDLDTGTVLRWMEGWTLRDCRIEGFSGAGINTGIGVRDIVVDGVESLRNGNAGIQVGLLTEGIEITGGYYHRNGTNGIDVNGTRCRIENNRVSRNGWNRLWDAGALRASDRNGILLYIAPFRARLGPRNIEADGNVVRLNEVADNERAGIMAVGTSAGTDIGAVQRNVLIEHNWSGRNLAGVMVEGAGRGMVRDAVIRRNKLVHNAGHSDGALKGWGFVTIGERNPGTRLVANTFAGNLTAPWLISDQTQVIEESNSVVETP